MTYSLYIKQHNITALKYFGVTTKTDPIKYRGSGVYWKRHISQHGYDVTTTIVLQTDDLEEASVFAMNFSLENNIVESKEWANLILEHCLDGKPVGSPGHIFTESEVAKMSAASKAVWDRPGYRERMRQAHSFSWNEERKTKQRQISKELWTDERKAAHSTRIKELHADPTKPMYDIGTLERTEQHNKSIGKALKGKQKTAQHRAALSAAKQNSTGRINIEGLVKLSKSEYLYKGWRISKVYNSKWKAVKDSECEYATSVTRLTLVISNKYLIKHDG